VRHIRTREIALPKPGQARPFPRSDFTVRAPQHVGKCGFAPRLAHGLLGRARDDRALFRISWGFSARRNRLFEGGARALEGGIGSFGPPSASPAKPRHAPAPWFAGGMAGGPRGLAERRPPVEEAGTPSRRGEKRAEVSPAGARGPFPSTWHRPIDGGRPPTVLGRPQELSSPRGIFGPSPAPPRTKISQLLASPWHRRSSPPFPPTRREAPTAPTVGKEPRRPKACRPPFFSNGPRGGRSKGRWCVFWSPEEEWSK
jgi:hypothetical protein